MSSYQSPEFNPEKLARALKNAICSDRAAVYTKDRDFMISAGVYDEDFTYFGEILKNYEDWQLDHSVCCLIDDFTDTRDDSKGSHEAIAKVAEHFWNKKGQYDNFHSIIMASAQKSHAAFLCVIEDIDIFDESSKYDKFDRIIEHALGYDNCDTALYIFNKKPLFRALAGHVEAAIRNNHVELAKVIVPRCKINGKFDNEMSILYDLLLSSNNNDILFVFLDNCVPMYEATKEKIVAKFVIIKA